MGSSMWRACTALVLALVIGCVAPHDREIVRPVPVPEAPDVPLPALVYDTYFTPRGTEVEAPGYIVERRDLFLLALQQIDELNFHIEFAGWVVRIEPPDGKELTNSAMNKIVVRWRAPDQEPRDVMLPNLRKLMEEVLHH